MESLNQEDFCRISSSFIKNTFKTDNYHSVYMDLMDMKDTNQTLERVIGSDYLKDILQQNLQFSDPNHFCCNPCTCILQ